MLVGLYGPAYSQSTWGPCGTMEEDSTKLVLGDLPTIILTFWVLMVKAVLLQSEGQCYTFLGRRFYFCLQ